MAPVWHALLGSAPAVSEAGRDHMMVSSPVDGLDGHPDLGTSVHLTSWTMAYGE
ncbi:hypothetical protein [Plantactinospora sp. WMMB782]|uniref:hypothetical protein n=1 Tax=Plantactinospora sp. WMMB782 TaxID=3404121 RepID=UPI003B93EDC2